MVAGEEATGAAVAVAAVRQEGGGVVGAREGKVVEESNGISAALRISYGKSAWLKVSSLEPGVVESGGIRTKGERACLVAVSQKPATSRA